MEIDLTSMTEEELGALILAVEEETARRSSLVSAADRINAINAEYHDAMEAELPPLAEGQHRPWRQPRGAHDAYPRGRVVAHKGKVWRNEHFSNGWEPGTLNSEWVEVDPGTAPDPDPDPGDYPAWVPGEAVATNDLRSWQGVLYRCVQGHTTQVGWEPPAVPALWTPHL